MCDKGKNAVLMQEKTGDIFRIDLGNIKYDEIIEIRFSYVCDLKMDGEKIRFRLPLNIMPRYCSFFRSFVLFILQKPRNAFSLCE